MHSPGTRSGLGSGELKQLRLRYAGVCVLCGTHLDQGAEALYDRGTRSVRCLVCPSHDAVDLEPIDSGVAGSSAHLRYVRLRAAREERVKGRLGNLLGGVVLAITDDPQSIRAWERGAVGERKLADALAGIDGLRVLHDRRVPRTRGNIDHIVIAPAGIFVVDAKRYKGLIRIRDRGGFFKTDLRLYVGNRDCSHLAENMRWQVDAVQRALHSADPDSMPPVTPVLCFVDGEWPLFSAPESYNSVRLEGKKSIRKLVTRLHLLDAAEIDRLTRILHTAFPPK